MRATDRVQQALRSDGKVPVDRSISGNASTSAAERLRQMRLRRGKAQLSQAGPTVGWRPPFAR
jgi:hypothetical protein